MEDRIAVVIPVYKVEKYLDRCVKSILNQDYTNLEIILVDDGSPDGCPQMCDEYAMKDNRIKVVHKKNGGLSDARNTGVLVAESKYVVFVDSDDFVEPNYVSSLADLREKFEVAIICSPLIYEFEDGTQKKQVKFDDQIVESEEVLAMVMRARYGIGVTACSKLFKKEILIEHPFPIGDIHEDLIIALELYSEVKQIAITNVSTYHYIQHSTSIMHSTINKESFGKILRYISSIINENNTIDLQRALVYRLYDLVNEYCCVIRYKNDKDVIRNAQKIIRQYRSIYIYDPENAYISKVKGWLLSTNYWSFSIFCVLKKFKEKSKYNYDT